MAAVVLDASIALAWCFDDEDPAPLALLERAGPGAFCAPGLWVSEVANGLVVAERRGRVAAADIDRFLALLLALQVTVEGIDAEGLLRVAGLAQRYQLSAYDATYLDLAIRLGASIATLDTALAQSARDAGVPTAL